MVNQIKIVGLKNVKRLLADLPESIKKQVGQLAPKKIAMSAQRRIKRRYNVLGYGTSAFSTGTGRKSISIKKTKLGYSLFVADYLDLLDKPIRTHWVSIETLEAHQAHPGSTMFKRAPAAFPFTRPPVLFSWRGPFITPAIKSLKADIPKIIEKAIARALAEADR